MDNRDSEELGQSLESENYRQVVDSFLEANPEDISNTFVEQACTAAFFGSSEPDLSVKLSLALSKPDNESATVVYLWYLAGAARWEKVIEVGTLVLWNEFEHLASMALAIGQSMVGNREEALHSLSRVNSAQKDGLTCYSSIVVRYQCEPTKSTVSSLVLSYKDSDVVFVRDMLLRLSSYHRAYGELRQLLKRESDECQRTYVLFSRFLLCRHDGNNDDALRFYRLIDSLCEVPDVAICFALGVFDCECNKFKFAIKRFRSIEAEIQCKLDRIEGLSGYYAWYSHACIKMWKVTDALEYAKKSLALDGRNAMALAVLARACLLKCRIKCFVKSFRELMALVRMRRVSKSNN